MQKYFDTILDFIKLRDKCLFCDGLLHASLTNYINPLEGGLLPVLDAPINSGRFTFQIKHTTQSYDIKANGAIDITNNTLVFTLPADSEMPLLDQHVTKQAFLELKPHIQLACNKCKNKYCISSYSLSAQRLANVNAWQIQPVKLFFESFRSGNLLVQNDWILEATKIYSTQSEEIEPMKVPFMEFDSMSKDKLLTRVSTLVTFS